MKMIEIMEDFSCRFGWFLMRNFIIILRWAKVIILGVLMIGYFALKEFFERGIQKLIKKKGGVR